MAVSLFSAVAATAVLLLFGFALGSATLGRNAAREGPAWSIGLGGDSAPGRLLTHLIALHHRRRPLRCVSLLADPLSGKSFAQSKLNQEAPLLADEIDYQQQPLRNSSAFAALARAKLEGCQMVAIFFANGKKLGQLLRAADRSRLLSSNVQLILPFRLRLFMPRMHNFWRRFLNVIFIRDTAERPRSSSSAETRRCLELSSVSFPAPVDPDHPETWLPLPVAAWCWGRFYNRRRHLFADKTADMKGEVLRVAFFEHQPAVTKLEEPMPSRSGLITLVTFSGVEVKIMNLLAKKINFTPLLQEVPSNMSNGVVESLVAGKADVALGSLAYVPYFQESSDLSDPYATYCYTFLTPEVIGDVSWRTLLMPFDKILWAYSAGALVIGWIAMLLVAKSQTEWCEHLDSLLCSALSTMSMQLMVPLPRAPNGWPVRLLFCSFWLHCLLLSVSYRASFASQLAKPPPRIAIDTVEKLAKATHLDILTFEYFAKDMFNSSPDESSKMIGERIKEVEMSIAEITNKIKEGKVAFFGNIHLLYSMKAESEKFAPGRRSVHLNEECVVSLPVSIGLARNSALSPQLNWVVRRAVESGLVTKWLQEAHGHASAIGPGAGGEAQPALVDLPKTVSVFAALGCGHLLASAVFLLELVLWKRRP